VTIKNPILDFGDYQVELGKVPTKITNVASYGATGDGNTDDTASIQAAIDATPPGGLLWLPPALTAPEQGGSGSARYKVTSTLNITKGITIWAPGVEITFQGTGAAFTITGKEVRIQGLYLSGVGANAPDGFTFATDARQCVIRDVIIDSFNGTNAAAIRIDTNTQVLRHFRFENVRIINGYHGIYLDGDSQVNDLTIINPVIVNLSGYGIHLKTGYGHRVIGGVVENNLLGNIRSEAVQSLIVEGVYFENGATVSTVPDIYLLNQSGFRVDTCYFNGAGLNGTHNYAIRFGDAALPVGAGSVANCRAVNYGSNFLQASNVSSIINVGALDLSALALVNTDRTSIQTILATQISLDFPSVANGAVVTLNVTVPGAQTRDLAAATPSGSIEAGLMWSAHVSTVDTVTVRLANLSGASVDPAARTWTIKVITQ